jgi:methylenetetrahydrofolate reductase (NADPH)
MRSLREALHETADFLIGVELVSIRGSMAEQGAVKARRFAGQLVESPHVDWISVTDNAGGNPQLAPQALAKPILYAGKEVVIHLTCKDLNRNGLESEAWQLNSEGFHNVLAMTGDYPIGGMEGMAKPVFDIDSVGLISLLTKMNEGMDGRHEKTEFCIGAVTSNYKLLEGEVVPQYLKLEKKVSCGAGFIINQVGYDSAKAAELRRYMDDHGMRPIPLIGNVYVLNPRVAQLFHRGRIAGIVLTRDLLSLCEQQAQSPDGGAAFFHELAAKQIAIFRGLGYRGAYLGGTHDVSTIERILDIERTFSPNDWRGFTREIAYSRPREFFVYGNPADNDPARPSPGAQPRPPRKLTHGGLGFRLSKWTHDLVFTPDRPLSRWGAKVVRRSKDVRQGPKPLRVLELVSKSLLFHCKDCGDCSLPEIAFLCPESQCAKNQRNGPCGGTREGRCEVDGFGDCIWLRAYERLKRDGAAVTLQHAPVLQNQGLRGTSSWANSWLGRDHAARRAAQLRSAQRPGGGSLDGGDAHE